jgi:hypothetical protein
MKKYYILGVLVILGLCLHEELQTPNSFFNQTFRYYLEFPTWPEYMFGNAKPMGHIKDTVPESPLNMTLKEFMASHVTDYWPGVFRGML